MITLTRLSGTAFLLNADLIERADATPDTVITLINGTKYVVAEPLDVVLADVVDYRARIMARSALFETTPQPARLAVVPDPTTHDLPAPRNGDHR